jgi:outer membrane receptor for ferrienterochelin and colicins
VGSVRLDTTLKRNYRSGNIYQTNAYVSGPLNCEFTVIRANGTYSQREEDEILGGYKDKTMRAGGAVLTLTPNEKYIDLEYQRSIQNRNGSVGKTIANARTDVVNFQQISRLIITVQNIV